MFDIQSPRLLLNEEICKRNIKRMVSKASENGLAIRPHFKTHQSHEVGEWFKEEGVTKITVSSMDMLEFFKGHFEHITLAIPFNPLQLDRLNDLGDSQNIAILIDNPETLANISAKIKHLTGVWLEIDTGSKRSGFDPSEIDKINETMEIIQKEDCLFLEGFYSHAGHTYVERSAERVLQVFENARKTMADIGQNFGGAESINLNLGDTPGCSLSENFNSLSSMSPGNFVFYDYMQTLIGSCEPKDIAVCLASPIISKHESRNEFVIYGGGIHLSKEQVKAGEVISYGSMVELSEGGWSEPVEGCYLRSISQEHGVLKVSDEVLSKYSVGDVIGILPVHSCMTADCMGEYYHLDGRPIDHMRKTR